MFRTLLLAFLLPVLLPGQATTAQLTGRLSDASGASIPGARITVTNDGTGAVRVTDSNELGNYTAPLLEPGSYTVLVEKEGFGTVSRTGITLHIDQGVRMDFVLQLGAVKETVSVTADAPLLQETEASLGTVIENSNILNMPLNGRNPFDLVFLAPGAVQYERLDLPGNNIALSNLSINGSPSMMNEVLLDGIPNTTPQHNQYALVPSIDAVQEFKVQTNNMSAEFGRTGGGVINVSMKAGTNRLHLTLYEFLRNSALDSNNWINKRTGTDKPKFVYNQLGATAGGPIKPNKVFFFVNYEALRRRLGKPFLWSVPTPVQREGDFSSTLNQRGELVTIYDPMTTRASGQGSANIRTPFPGNKIAASRYDPAALKLMKYWAAPNLPGEPLTGLNNFITSKSEQYSVDQLHLRGDYNFSNKFQMFGRFSWNTSDILPPNVFDNVGNPASGPQLFTQRNAGASGTYSINARTFATFRLGYLRYRDHSEPLGMGFDVTTLGFPAYFRDAIATRTFPSFNVNGYAVSNIGFGTSSLGPVAGALLNNITNTYSGQSDVTHIRGSHVLKTGYEARVFRIAGDRPNLPIFNVNRAFTQGPNPSAASDRAGNSIASFILGTAAGGNVQLRPTQDCQSYYMGTFLQDDYKLTRTLTLNLGVRLDYETLRTDRYDRLNWLDLTTPMPLQVPGVAELRGGLQFVGVGNNPREQAAASPRFSPRFGFAWQAQPKMTVRGGYGIFTAPRSGGEFNGYGQVGFQAQTQYVGSVNGLTPTSFLSDPYPNGFVQPTGSSLGLLTNLGGPISSVDSNSTSAYVQQWNFNIQRAVGGQMVAEIAYAGSKGTHLPQNLDFNQLPDQYLALGDELNKTVANPFFGFVADNQPLGKKTTTVAQLLRPYPQFTDVSTVNSTAGSSIYHSMQTRLQKRLSHGVTFLVSYTNSKLIDDGAQGRLSFFGNVPNFQNANNRRLERSISSQEVSQRLAANYSIQLPFGKGQRLFRDARGVLGALAGGWQLNGIHSFQTGRPVSVTTSVNSSHAFNGTSRPDSTGRSAKLSGAPKDRIDRYFDIEQFTQPAPYTFGNVSRTLPDVRTPGQVIVDFSLMKNTRIGERANLQFRFEAFNAINWTNLGRPNSVLGNADFGIIRNAQDMRILQFGLKLYY